MSLFIVRGVVLGDKPLLALDMGIRGLAAVLLLVAVFYNRSWFHVLVFAYSATLFMVFAFTVRLTLN